VRKPNVTRGIKENPAVFVVTSEWDSLPENTFDSLRFHRCDCNVAGIDDLGSAGSLRIFPNPSVNGELHITSGSFIREVQVIDMVGNIVLRKEPAERVNSCIILPGEELKGLYFIRVYSADGVSNTGKIMIQ
jgi:hypothetical protein